jgi:MFS family permease
VLHASAVEVSLVTAAEYVAWIFIGLPAGVLVARLPLRGTQIVMDVVRAAAISAVPLAWWAGKLSVAVLVGAAVVISFANVIFDVGNATFLPAIVGADELESRNSVTSGVEATTQLGGPSLGGLLVQLMGAAPALVIDAMSYLVSAALLGTLPARRSPAAVDGRRAGQIREGWRYVSRHPLMGPCTLAATLINFVCGALMALAPLYLVRVLGAPAGLVGLLIASEGVGMLVGAAITTRVTARFGSARGLIIAGAVGGLLGLLIPLGHGGPGMITFAIGNAGFAGGVVVLSIIARTFRQLASPPELLSRVVATVRFVSWGAIPVGALLAGVIANESGPRVALWVFCLFSLLTPLMLVLSPVGRRHDLMKAPPAMAGPGQP